MPHPARPHTIEPAAQNIRTAGTLGAEICTTEVRDNSTQHLSNQTASIVAFTGTNPRASETIFIREMRVESESSNRFSMLRSLDCETEQQLEEQPSSENVSGNMDNTAAVLLSKVCSQVELEEAERGLDSVETENFLGKVGSCLEICNVIVDSLATSVKANSDGEPDNTSLVHALGEETQGQKSADPVVNKLSSPVDKGGTTFDPSNPDTWTEAMRDADKKIALVKPRMENPEPVKLKPTKVDLRVKLVRGNSGVPIRSSSRNKR